MLDAHRCFTGVVTAPASAWRADHLTSEPVIPGGSGGAGCGANGFSSCVGWRFRGFLRWRRCLRPARASRLSTTNTKGSRLQPHEKQHWTLGSSFLLWRFFLQHSLHNPDLGALRIVRIRREVEDFGVLPGAGGVEQIFHHDQRAIVVLNHPRQK